MEYIECYFYVNLFQTNTDLYITNKIRRKTNVLNLNYIVIFNEIIYAVRQIIE